MSSQRCIFKRARETKKNQTRKARFDHKPEKMKNKATKFMDEIHLPRK